jgi:hypothetical protein
MNGCTTKAMTRLSVFCYFFFELFTGFVFSLTEFARLRTQRKPMYERGWFWYSLLRQAERM